MKATLLKSILLSMLLALALQPAQAQTRIDVKLDSVYIVMGRTTTLHLDVTKPKDAKGNLTILQKMNQEGFIPVCGDSVELRQAAKIDTVESGNSVTLKYQLLVQSFDSGYYRLPEFEYVSGTDTARSKQLSLKVVPVQAKADDPIHDYASVSAPDGSSIFDHVPDWVLDYWWILLFLLLAIALFVYAMRRYKREGHILPKKPEPTPYEAAMAALRHLKQQKLWEQGMEKEFYTDLTEILRKYLAGRFGINAMEMTSREILQALGKNQEIAEHRISMRQILDMADFVKFAKVRPLPEDNVKSFDNALKFVQETKPQPVAETPEGKPASAAGNGKSGNRKLAANKPRTGKTAKGGEK